MTPYLTCDAAIERLEAFVDGELPMEEQVAVESHLRWCCVCTARVADMQLIGGSMRLVASAGASNERDAREFAAVQSDVLTRVRAERDQSFMVRLSAQFADSRLLWPALGATAAVVACLFVATGVFAMATAEENSRSMAAMIETLAHPGSDRNPVNLDGRLSAPRSLDASLVSDSIVGDDTAYAVSAVVTREGRVVNYSLLMSDGPSGRRHATAATDDLTAALLEAVKHSRFEPAQTKAGGAVAVNVVWLVARTTVKGSARVELALPQMITVPVRAPQPKPAESDIPSRRRAVGPPSPTA